MLSFIIQFHFKWSSKYLVVLRGQIFFLFFLQGCTTMCKKRSKGNSTEIEKESLADIICCL